MEQPDFQLLFESSPALFLVLRPDFTIAAASHAYLAATMTRREDVVGRGLFEVFPDNPAEREATGVSNLRASLERVKATLQADTMAVQKYDIRRPDGSFEVRHWSPANFPVPGRDGALAYIIHRVEDVTDFVRFKDAEQATSARLEREVYLRAQEIQVTNARLRAANQELGQRNEELAHASQVKNQFLASMSHELRTPLNSIIGFSELLIDGKAGPLEARQVHYLGNVHRSGRHLLALINDLLDVSRIEAGRLEVVREPCDAAQLLAEAADALEPQARARQLALELAPGPWPQVVGDAGRIKQIFFNILGNAIKFSPPGAAITAHAEVIGKSLRVAVRDRGEGIASADLPRLFSRFSQLPSGQRAGGTGLGLALCKELALAMGGDVGVESSLGVGSTFFVDLPLSR